jgi:hypothetical protein
MSSALGALRSLLSSACLNCAAFVFQELGSIYDQPAFSKFLNLHPGMFDGTTSNMPLKQICTWGSWNGIQCSLGLRNSTETIAQAFQSTSGTTLAMSQMKASNGLLTFWNPPDICKVYAGPSSGFNQAQLFHESLHGFYGKDDGTIQKAFGLKVEPQNSITISYYIDQKVFKQPEGTWPSICGN